MIKKTAAAAIAMLVLSLSPSGLLAQTSGGAASGASAGSGSAAGSPSAGSAGTSGVHTNVSVTHPMPRVDSTARLEARRWRTALWQSSGPG